jgi:hypothetical protein
VRPTMSPYLAFSGQQASFPHKRRPIVSQNGDKLASLFGGDAYFPHQALNDLAFPLFRLVWLVGHPKPSYPKERHALAWGSRPLSAKFPKSCNLGSPVGLTTGCTKPTEGCSVTCRPPFFRQTGYNPEQLAMLSKVLDDHCLDHCIKQPGPDYEDASYLILALFRDGAQTVEQLKTALDAVLTGRERRHA